MKEHAFFKDINFDDVLARRIQPPFVPDVKEDRSYAPKNFDSDFTNEDAADSFTFPIFGELQKVQGFSYTSDELINDYSNNNSDELKIGSNGQENNDISPQSAS